MRPQVIDAESFLAAFRVSRETMARLTLYESLLLKWQKSINLVSAATLPDLWRRHMADSAQLARLAPATACIWVDLGSGAGFPGLVVAIIWADRAGPSAAADFMVHLIESDQRKGAFLREVIRQTGAPAMVHTARIESFARSGLPGPADLALTGGNLALAGGNLALAGADVISARACAPLDRLLTLAAPFFGPDSLGLFLKGRDADKELTLARKWWTFNITQIASMSDPEGTVLEVKGLSRAAP